VQRQVIIHYLDSVGAAATYQTYSGVPDGATLVPQFVGKWITSTIPIDLQKFITAVPTYQSIVYVEVIFRSVAYGSAALGTEYILLDNLALFPSKYSQRTYNDNFAATFSPVELRPNAVKTPLMKLTNNTLPAASITYEGEMRLVFGGSGVADRLYLCMKSATNTFSWVVIATG
jgi:hypothetical protein